MPRADIVALSGNWKALLISPNRGVTSELTQILSRHLPSTPVFEMQTYPARHNLAEFSGSKGPNLCFLDLITDSERGLALIGELLAVQPSMKILVLLQSKNPDTILRAMRQGAAEFIVRPVDPDQLDSALERIASLSRNDSGFQQQGKVITVIPSKGACGATTIAANLAQHFRRVGYKKILLADMDPLTGTLAFLLKLKSNYSFLDALSRATNMDADIWKGIVTTHGGIDVLLAPDSVNDALHELRDASLIVDFARGFYDVVILDVGTVFSDWSMSVASRSDDVVLVTTNELPALQSAQRAITYLENNRIQRTKIRLVVNRYSNEYGLSRDVIETALHCDVFHQMPSDYESVHRALIESKPVQTNTAFGKSVTQLGDRLAGRPAGGNHAPKKTSALSGLFSLFTKSPAQK